MTRISFFAKAVLLFFVCLSTSQTWAQCSNVPTVEAVRNGNFEAGYINKSGTGHTYTAGGPFDFQSDLTSVANYNAGAPFCLGGIPGQYGVARNEAALMIPCGNTKPYLGNGYLSATQDFDDHTPGMNGDGFAFIGDFEGTPPASSYGGPYPAIWRQRVTIFPNQPYYFSAWFANYNRDADLVTYNDPNLKFVVIPINGSGTLMTGLRTEVGNASPSGEMDWQQFSGSWVSPVGYTEAMIYIEVEQASDANTNDLAIDDISFINGCQNLASLPAALTPSLGATQSICVSNGTITLNSNVTPGGSTEYFWYSGTGSSQTIIGSPTGSTTQNTINITTAGTYRVCVQNASFIPASCAASSTIVITNTMPSVSVSDQTICSAANVTIAANVVSPFLTYNWTVPAAFTPNPGNVSSFSTSVTGTYNVSVTSPVAGCAAQNDGAVVTSNLANGTVNSVVNCAGASKTFNVTASGGAGSTYSWYTAASGGTELATGASTVVGVPSSPTTVYVENFSTVTLKTDKASYSSGNDGGDNARSYSNFVANTQFVLVSVEVQPVYCGDANFRVSLFQNGVLVPGTNVVRPCATGAWITVPLNYTIPAGTGYELRINGNTGGRDDFLINTTTSSNTTTTAATISNNAHGWGAFTNWVTKSSSCIRTPVVLDCALPVNFVYFDATAENNNTVLLNWITSVELNNAGFDVERSADGATFDRIGHVQGYNSAGQYAFVDEHPLSNTSYYRLRQIDLNGAYTYSSVEAVNLTGREIHVQPNPNNGAFSVSLVGESDAYALEISDATGRTLRSTTVQGSEHAIDLSTYPKGIYILHVFNQNINFFERIVVE